MHEPAVVLTDLALALLGAYLAWRLARAPTGAAVMGGLASAAFWGMLFHAFFPAKTTTTAGFVAWMPVAFSIIVVAGALLALALPVLLPRLGPRGRRTLVALYAAAFAAVVLFVDESFVTIVRFYAPVLVLALGAALLAARRTGGAGGGGWTLIAAGLAVAAAAALLQQAGVAIHPVYFDHNALYHVIQGVALVLLYLGFRARRRDPAPRAA